MTEPTGREAETRRLERREFERGHIEPGEEPVTPLPAATVVVARAADGGMEVLLLRRPSASTFAAGAYVFPGGRVDPGDRGEGILGRVDPEAADGESDALVAAARELWEETGLLSGRPGADVGEDVRAAARRDLVSGERAFVELARDLRLELPGSPVAYFARWITPESLSRRYDTRFFLARDPGGDIGLTREHTDAAWLAPARALERFDAGDLPLLFPTRRTLERLAGYPDPRTAIAELRAEPVEPVRPRLLVRDEGVVPVLPGDPEYGEAGLAAG